MHNVQQCNAPNQQWTQTTTAITTMTTTAPTSTTTTPKKIHCQQQQNKTKQNKDRTKTKQNKTKQNKTKQRRRVDLLCEVEKIRNLSKRYEGQRGSRRLITIIYIH